MKTHENKVTGLYAGIVRGKATGLAGCSESHRCAATDFLRADPMLEKSDLGCRQARFYIPLVQVSK